MTGQKGHGVGDQMSQVFVFSYPGDSVRRWRVCVHGRRVQRSAASECHVVMAPPETQQGVLS